MFSKITSVLSDDLFSISLGLSVSLATLSLPLLDQLSLSSDFDGDQSVSSSCSLASALLVANSDEFLMLLAPSQLDVDLLEIVQVILVLSVLADDNSLLSWYVDSSSVGLVLDAFVVSVDLSIFEALSVSSSSNTVVL